MNQTQVQRNLKNIPFLSAIGILIVLSAHNFLKLTQLKAYISMYKHDFLCFSETYLDSSTPDGLLKIDGHNLFLSDHPNNIKRVGVCIYYKESLPVQVISLPHLKEA